MGNRAAHWSDRLAEWCGAVALAGGAGASAWLLAPLIGQVPAALAAIATVAGGLGGWALVRAAPSSGDERLLPTFAIEPVADVLRAEPAADGLLLLERVAFPEASRVVQLFAPGPPAFPGEVQARIAAHLADPSCAARSADRPTPWAGPSAIPDASEALYAALADIRRSLRAG